MTYTIIFFNEIETTDGDYGYFETLDEALEQVKYIKDNNDSDFSKYTFAEIIDIEDEEMEERVIISL